MNAIKRNTVVISTLVFFAVEVNHIRMDADGDERMNEEDRPPQTRAALLLYDREDLCIALAETASDTGSAEDAADDGDEYAAEELRRLRKAVGAVRVNRYNHLTSLAEFMHLANNRGMVDYTIAGDDEEMEKLKEETIKVELKSAGQGVADGGGDGDGGGDEDSDDEEDYLGNPLYVEQISARASIQRSIMAASNVLSRLHEMVVVNTGGENILDLVPADDYAMLRNKYRKWDFFYTRNYASGLTLFSLNRHLKDSDAIQYYMELAKLHAVLFHVEHAALSRTPGYPASMPFWCKFLPGGRRQWTSNHAAEWHRLRSVVNPDADAVDPVWRAVPAEILRGASAGIVPPGLRGRNMLEFSASEVAQCVVCLYQNAVLLPYHKSEPDDPCNPNGSGGEGAASARFEFEYYLELLKLRMAMLCSGMWGEDVLDLPHYRVEEMPLPQQGDETDRRRVVMTYRAATPWLQFCSGFHFCINIIFCSSTKYVFGSRSDAVIHCHRPREICWEHQRDALSLRYYRPTREGAMELGFQAFLTQYLFDGVGEDVVIMEEFGTDVNRIVERMVIVPGLRVSLCCFICAALLPLPQQPQPGPDGIGSRTGRSARLPSFPWRLAASFPAWHGACARLGGCGGFRPWPTGRPRAPFPSWA
jgi:hypothetical protein